MAAGLHPLSERSHVEVDEEGRGEAVQDEDAVGTAKLQAAPATEEAERSGQESGSGAGPRRRAPLPESRRQHVGSTNGEVVNRRTGR